MKKSNYVTVTIKNHKDKKGGHPHIILDNIDKHHVSVGLTTKPKKGKNSPNYKMEESPLKNGKQSYMRRQGTVAPQNEYYGNQQGKITKTDYGTAKKYGDKAKEKFILKQKDNGSAKR